MTKNKKISRKQLLKEPDEFITTTGKMIRWTTGHRKQITYALGALALILVAATGFRYYLSVRENRAFSRLDAALDRYAAASAATDAQQAYRDVREEFESLVAATAGSSAGKLARMAFGDICFAGGDYEAAIGHYTRALELFEAEAFYRKLILGGIGYAYAEKGDLKSAVSYFERLREANGDFSKDEALFQLGVLYDTLGDTDKSRSAYKQIVSDFPDSAYANISKEKIPG